MPLQITERALDWALGHINTFGDTDIFPAIFEFKALTANWDEVKPFLKDSDILKWTVRPYRRCLVPKHRFGFRVSTQLDPLDTLVFTSLIFECGARLEAQRVPVTDDIVHSYRFRPDTSFHMFAQSHNYRTFQSKSQQLCLELSPTHVVVADIADFFPRIYTHRIENMLDSALGHGHMHAKAIKDLINHWAGSYSYGIPVGTTSSRLIVEATIGDLDQALLAEGIKYIRYSDDFRIFSPSETHAYRSLAFLAKTLFENHGLTLQQHKTKIIPIEKFKRDYLKENETREIDTLSEQFYELLSTLGIKTNYEDIDISDLSDAQQQALSQLNLNSILEEQINLEEPDLSLIKFTLRRLTQLGDLYAVDLIFNNLNKFTIAIKETVEYLNKILSIPDINSSEICRKAIEAYRNTNQTISSLEYAKMSMLSVLKLHVDSSFSEELTRLYTEATDQYSIREIILAMGKAKQAFWFRSKKSSINEMTPWARRAFIYAASCLPAEEYKHWGRGMLSQFDIIERSIFKWAQVNPI